MINKTLYALSAVAIMTLFIYLTPSCNGNDKKQGTIQKEGQARLFAIILDTSGKKVPVIVLRVTTKGIKYDSTTKQDKIVYQEIFGVERSFPILDSLKHPIKDSLGNIRYGSAWFPIGKDSVELDVCGKNIDSLIKK